MTTSDDDVLSLAMLVAARIGVQWTLLDPESPPLDLSAEAPDLLMEYRQTYIDLAREILATLRACEPDPG